MLEPLIRFFVILAHLELIIDFDNEFHCLSLPQGCINVGILEAGGQCHGMYIPGTIDLVPV